MNDDVYYAVYIMKMVRKQFYITEEQDAKLKSLSASMGVTEAELVRMALERLNDVTYDQDEASAAGRLREVALMERYTACETGTDTTGAVRLQRFDGKAWEAEMAFMRSLAAEKEAAGTTWQFNRDELYDERLDKILRRH